MLNTSNTAFTDSEELKMSLLVGHMLDSLYQSETAGNPQKSMVDVYRWVHNAMAECQYELCDLLLQRLDMTRVSTGTLLAALTCTRHERERFPSRQSFLSRATAVLESSLGKEAASRVLGNVK